MEAEVVVVGGGIGGLTVAALLAARGVKVCLLERESQVGGCAASFEKFGYSFEQGYGLYAGWEPDEIHSRVFAELPVDAPEVQLLDPAYVVRLPDKIEVPILNDPVRFEGILKLAFPECAVEAVSFYRKLATLSSTYRGLLQRTPDFLEAARPRKRLPFFSAGKGATEILNASQQTTREQLGGTSLRFRRFIDVQLQALGQATSDDLSYLYAALLLTASRGGLFTIGGGAASLASRLEESIKQSGGTVRLNAPVLRLAYDSRGEAVGVDLLSGETVNASRAMVSNLTIWDTYGKLVGLDRTPTEIRQHLKSKHGWGAYQLYLGWDEAAASALGAGHVLTLSNWHDEADYDAQNSQMFFCPTPEWDPRAPEGKRAVTVHTFSEVDDWFTFHTDESDLEDKDQQMLESSWNRLHASMPELGDSLEVIESSNPRSVYEQTRRKLGMVGNLPATTAFLEGSGPTYLSSLPNLFIISDTTTFGGIAGLTYSAKALAERLLGPKTPGHS